MATALDAESNECADMAIPPTPPSSPLALIAARARHPDLGRRRALICIGCETSMPSGNVEWSFSELWARTIAAASYLRTKQRAVLRSGKEPPLLSPLQRASNRSHVIGVMVEEGLELAVAELAIAVAGCAISPLCTSDPPSRLASVLEDISCATVIVDSQRDPAAVTRLCQASRMRKDGIQDLLVLEASKLLDADDANMMSDDSIDETDPESLSHVFFTSGSTGRPKGCILTRNALAYYCEAKNMAQGVREGDIVFVASPHTFDPSLGDFFATWAAGAVVALAPRSLIFTQLGTCLANTGATHVTTTPSMLTTISTPLHIPLPNLRVVVLGGETAPASLMVAWHSVVPTLLVTYGVTECCVYQTYDIVHDVCQRRSLGKPLSRHGCRILLVREPGDYPFDFLAENEPADTTAEVWIAGPMVGLGYANAPELTEERFRVIETDGVVERWFRTGDIVRRVLRHDGSSMVEIIGRRDTQVKMNGQRVELGEIEAAVQSSELVSAAACVISSIGSAPHDVLTAHVVPSPTEIQLDEAMQTALELHASLKLAPHMVPRIFVTVQDGTMPLTSSGKVDKLELQRLQNKFTMSRETTQNKADMSWLEEKISHAWAEALGLPEDSISLGDNFGTLGGNSLSALRATRALIRSTDIKVETKVDDFIGIQSGEAAALLTAETTPNEAKACSFGLIDGPLAPCELMRRPILRDYANFLSRSGVLLDPSDKTDEGALHVDIRNPTYEQVHRKIDSREMRALIAACGNGRISLVRSLLWAGVCPNGRSSTGLTPLHTAAASGSRQAASCVRALLSAGADPTAATNAGTLPLHLAAARGDIETLQVLISAGSPVGVTDDDKQTILHLAARSGSNMAAEIASLACAPLSTRFGGLEAWDKWKRTAADWAQHYSNSEVLLTLRESGSRLNTLSTVLAELADSKKSNTSHRTQKPERKKARELSTMETLVTHLGGPSLNTSIQAAAGLREIVCANAKNRETARISGAFEPLTALVALAIPFLRGLQTGPAAQMTKSLEAAIHAAGALRNLSYGNPTNRRAAANAGAVETLAEVLRLYDARIRALNVVCHKSERQLAFLAASALINLTWKNDENKRRLDNLGISQILSRTHVPRDADTNGNLSIN